MKVISIIVGGLVRRNWGNWRLEEKYHSDQQLGSARILRRLLEIFRRLAVTQFNEYTVKTGRGREEHRVKKIKPQQIHLLQWKLICL